MKQEYGCVVIGGGHAGIEAAYSASLLLENVALVTLAKSNLGQMSCNPSVGGIGKGIIVKEVDALGGIMGILTDGATTHFKMLNKTKGQAVWGPRSQTDRALYHARALEMLGSCKNLDIIENSAEDIEIENGVVSAVILGGGQKLKCKTVILTTGTFLSGMILIGNQRIPAGRINERASYGLSKTLARHGFALGRLKTGTPPRIYKDTINFSQLEKQEGDEIEPFSYVTEKVTVPQLECYITHTNKEAHEVYFQNRHLSPIYTKEIEAKGPRYCPSIEDKTIRFAENDSHRIFLEQEGVGSNLVYPAGISTAMPPHVQDEFISKIKGLENAKIAQHGYAIEYDYVNPQELLPTLETKKIKNLFFAGQINGTTGYEEAAGQGIIAGINACQNVLNRKPFILSRTESYIGVMINDLVTKGITEPYRMFTSRCEHRISVRADNANFRLTPHAISLGLASAERTGKFLQKKEQFEKCKALLESISCTPNELMQYGIDIAKDGIRRNGFELLAHQMIDISTIANIIPNINNFDTTTLNSIITEAKYFPYLARQEQDIKIIKEQEKILIPHNIDFGKIKSLSNEVVEKLQKYKPYSIADALKIEGITPSAIIAISLFLKSFAG